MMNFSLSAEAKKNNEIINISRKCSTCLPCTLLRKKIKIKKLGNLKFWRCQCTAFNDHTINEVFGSFVYCFFTLPASEFFRFEAVFWVKKRKRENVRIFFLSRVQFMWKFWVGFLKIYWKVYLERSSERQVFNADSWINH